LTTNKMSRNLAGSGSNITARIITIPIPNKASLSEILFNRSMIGLLIFGAASTSASSMVHRLVRAIKAAVAAADKHKPKPLQLRDRAMPEFALQGQPVDTKHVPKGDFERLESGVYGQS
jgi:hypothetical protein